tara:strand:- start:2104 stop:2271 length:168 start_codon:yes stop_codon:yes gene_type:complete
MDDLNRRKKTRTKNALFNPYINGISSYDLAYLSSKKVVKKKSNYFKKDYCQDFAA